jgi:hypothetical protein
MVGQSAVTAKQTLRLPTRRRSDYSKKVGGETDSSGDPFGTSSDSMKDREAFQRTNSIQVS